MPDQKQLRKVWLLSDTVLYDEAVAFMRDLVDKRKCNPLPSSQIAGLLNIAETASYGELADFIIHQRSRDWPPGARDIKAFYTALEETLREMRSSRLREEFHLLDGVSPEKIQQETEALMALLAREFIQHLAAENGFLAVKIAEQRSQQKSSRR
jgi:hypothetical protein